MNALKLKTNFNSGLYVRLARRVNKISPLEYQRNRAHFVFRPGLSDFYSSCDDETTALITHNYLLNTLTTHAPNSQ
jgi:hypothetical protein